jgi:RTX calcium-binding nonapeptide repeat (4 copies)
MRFTRTYRFGLAVSLAAIGVLGAVPATALGDSEVTYEPLESGGEVDVIDVDGTPNDISISQTDSTITVNDTAAPLVPTDPCVEVDANTVNCPVFPPPPDPPVTTVFVDLFEGDDRFAFVGTTALEENTVNGGLGDDDMTGSEAQDFMEGDAGNDAFRALGGDDEMFGAAGDDVLNGGEGFDVNDCGAGFDLALLDPDDGLFVDSDCERVGAFVLNDTSRTKRRKAKIKVDCPATELSGCTGDVTLYNGEKTVGTGTFAGPAGETILVKVLLKKGVARALDRDDSLFVTAEVTIAEPGGTSVNSKTVLLLG